MRSVLTPVVAATVAAIVAPALAQPFTFQGSLNESGGPANGEFNFTFFFYDRETGGTLLDTNNRFDVEVVDGLFTVELESAAVEFAHAQGSTVWVRINVSRPGEISSALEPRIKITSAPRATVAELALEAETSLQDAFDEGGSIETPDFLSPVFIGGAGGLTVEDTLRVGASGLSAGRFELNSAAGTILSLSRASSGGGNLNVFDGLGNAIGFLQPDISEGGGGFFNVRRNGTASGVTIDGNYLGRESARMSIFGTQSPMFFDSSVAGELSVQLPDNSIGASETSQEAGVALDRATPNADLDNFSGFVTVASRTITLPGPGHVIAFGSMEIGYNGVIDSGTGGGLAARVQYGLSTNGTSIANGMDYSWEVNIPSIDAIPFVREFMSGNDTLAFSDVLTFSTSGSQTIDLIADGTIVSGTVNDEFLRVQDVNMILLYVPTSYGAIARGETPGGSQPGLEDSAHPPVLLTPGMIEAEQIAELRRRDAEREAELRATKDRLAEIERMLKNANTPE